jgi:dephospho-CoA kinase
MRVGLTGGIGSGKGEVGAVFASLGALLIDADELAREAVAPGSDGLRRVLERWPETRAADGTLDRTALAAKVFADPGARADLNAIVHPAVRELAAARERSAAPGQVVVHEVPLLFETDFDRGCDATVVVVAEPERRIARVLQRSGLSREEVERRMAAQMDPAEASRRATFTIVNDGSLDEVRARARAVWEALRDAAPKAS